MKYRQLKGQVAWAWRQTSDYRIRIFLYILLEVLNLICSLAFVYFSKKAVDEAVKNPTGNFLESLLLMVIFIAFGIGFGLMSSWISENIKMRMTVKLQASLMDAQMNAVWKQSKKWHTGDLLVRMNSDCDEVVQMLSYSIPTFFVTSLKLIASIGFLWTMDPALAWMLLCVSPLFLFSKIYYKKIRRLNQDVKRTQSSLGTIMQENLKNRLLIRALQAGGVCKKRFQVIQANLFDLRKKQLNFFVSTQGIIKYAFNGGYLLAFIWGVYRLYLHEITFGTMTAFLQLVSRIQMPLLAMIAFVPAAIRSLNSMDRLKDLLNEEVEKEVKPLLVSGMEQVVFKDVSFRYEEQEVLSHFDAVFRIGQPTALVGGSGRGKTTIIRLLLAMFSPEKGEVLIENSKNEKISVTPSTRLNFAYVPQGNSLFSGTIRENLLMGNPAASDEKIQEVLHVVSAEFVEQLPDGLNHVIGESGLGLSEGQAQRIAIARALLQDKTTVWLFDEVTSALDKKNSGRIIERLIEAGKDKIIIFVTHDMDLARQCSLLIPID